MGKGRRAITDDEQLLAAAVKNAGAGMARAPRWSRVGQLLELDSAAAAKLCERFDADPVDSVGGHQSYSHCGEEVDECGERGDG